MEMFKLNWRSYIYFCQKLNLTGSDLNFVDERLLVRRFELHVWPLGLDVALAEHDDRLPAVLHAAEDLRRDVLAHVPVAAVDTHLQSLFLYRYFVFDGWFFVCEADLYSVSQLVSNTCLKSN